MLHELTLYQNPLIDIQGIMYKICYLPIRPRHRDEDQARFYGALRCVATEDWSSTDNRDDPV